MRYQLVRSEIAGSAAGPFYGDGSCDWRGAATRQFSWLFAAALAGLTLWSASHSVLWAQEATRREPYAAARELTQAWIEQTLDRQWRQLQQNGLEHSELGEAIGRMRRDSSRLAAEDMARLVELARSAGGADQPPGEGERRSLRGESRRVLGELLEHRREIVTRQRQAELHRLAQGALDAQQLVVSIVASIDRLPAARQNSELARSIEAQLDVQLMVNDLFETVRRAEEWEGESAAIAAKARETLERMQADQRATGVVNYLTRADLDAAQQGAVELRDALAELVKLLDQRQEDERELENHIAELQERQQQLLDQSSAAAAGVPSSTAVGWADQQQRLAEQIQRAADQAPGGSQSRDTLEAAAESARQAASELFEQRIEAGRQSQAEVVERLGEAANQLDADSQQAGDGGADARPNDDDSSPAEPAENVAGGGAGAEQPGEQQLAEAPAQPGTGGDAPATGNTGGAQSLPSDAAELPVAPAGESTWFAELPPGVRDAVRAAGRGAAPARYQEILRRYFSRVGPQAPRARGSESSNQGR